MGFHGESWNMKWSASRYWYGVSSWLARDTNTIDLSWCIGSRWTPSGGNLLGKTGDQGRLMKSYQTGNSIIDYSSLSPQFIIHKPNYFTCSLGGVSSCVEAGLASKIFFLLVVNSTRLSILCPLFTKVLTTVWINFGFNINALPSSSWWAGKALLFAAIITQGVHCSQTWVPPIPRMFLPIGYLYAAYSFNKETLGVVGALFSFHFQYCGARLTAWRLLSGLCDVLLPQYWKFNLLVSPWNSLQAMQCHVSCEIIMLGSQGNDRMSHDRPSRFVPQHHQEWVSSNSRANNVFTYPR